MQTRDEVEGLHNCREFSQPLECLYQAMQTQEKSLLQLLLPFGTAANTITIKHITQSKFIEVFQSLVPDKPSNTIDLVFMYYLWHDFLICPFQVELTIFVLIALSFRLISVYSGVIPVRSGTILVHSVSFRRHSGSFRFIPAYSGIFRSVPFRSCVQ